VPRARILLLLVRRFPLAAEASIYLTLASLRVACYPRSRTAHLLGRARPVDAANLPAGSACAEALLVGRAVEQIAPLLPWHPVCLPRAAAVASMLRRRGIDCEAHVGVIESEPRGAHAWVTVGGVVVQGGPVDHVREVASFVETAVA
jgi:hypothetical protein